MRDKHLHLLTIAHIVIAVLNVSLSSEIQGKRPAENELIFDNSARHENTGELKWDREFADDSPSQDQDRSDDEFNLDWESNNEEIIRNAMREAPAERRKSSQGPYTPDWKSLDSRPLPTWYDEAKFGIFIHWGIWSVPGYGGEPAYFWWDYHNGAPNVVDFMKKNYRPSFTYPDFAAEFKPNMFDAHSWVRTFQESGAKYIVFVSKHHDGFPMWRSKYSFGWNSAYTGPNRDFVGELEEAVRNSSDLHFGLYHSLLEWFNPLFMADSKAEFKTNRFPEWKTIPELYELVEKYKPDVLWSDGDSWQKTEIFPEYWNSTHFLAWLYNESPVKDVVVTNDRWGYGSLCHHGGYYTCRDKYNPKKLQKHKFENCLTLDRGAWGYRRLMQPQDVLSVNELATILAETISCGGNMLLNVGPQSDGTIPVIFQERLKEFGAWLRVNGEAVYGSLPWTYQNDTLNPHVWYTKRELSAERTVYAFVLDWPENDIVELGAPEVNDDTEITMLGLKKPLSYKVHEGVVSILLPYLNDKTMPCREAWVLRMKNLTNA